jgi:hypothetical protein
MITFNQKSNIQKWKSTKDPEVLILVCAICNNQETFIQGSGWEIRRKEATWEDPSIDGEIILEWFFKKYCGKTWTGLIWLRLGTGGR